MKIVVLGGEGMLGHKMFQILTERYPDTWCTLRGEPAEPFYARIPLFRSAQVLPSFDVMDWPAVARRLGQLKPDYVVNCVGIVKQRPLAREAIPSITINSLLPHQLAQLTSSWGGRLIHFSTDCVFDGKAGGYTEESPSNAEDLYGKSKFLGEVSGEANALTLRTSIIGRELAELQSLLEWFLSNRGGTVKGFKRVIYSGVTTNFLAELVGRLMAEHPGLSGLYQVAGTPISKHDLLCRLNEAYRLNITIAPEDETVSDRSLRGDKLEAATGYTIPAWPQLIAELVGDRTPYEQWTGRMP